MWHVHGQLLAAFIRILLLNHGIWQYSSTRRHHLSLQKKTEVIRKAPIVRQCENLGKFGFGKTQISDILKTKESLITSYEAFNRKMSDMFCYLWTMLVAILKIWKYSNMKIVFLPKLQQLDLDNKIQYRRLLLRYVLAKFTCSGASEI